MLFRLDRDKDLSPQLVPSTFAIPAIPGSRLILGVEASSAKMPYTPPSHRSPASSAPSSPDASRRPSIHQSQQTHKPTLPRSASYLTKHRRTPSASGSIAGYPNELTPAATSEDLSAMAKSSVRQSPPPLTSDVGMPSGAVISPPDSASEDEGQSELLGETRGRQIENLKELHDIVSQIPQNRSSSPAKSGTDVKETTDAGDLLVLPSQANAIAEGMQTLSIGSRDDLAVRGNRRFSHARSATEPNLTLLKKSGSSLTVSEESEDETPRPQMVRKKSGELVRPALRPASRHRRPSSMPGTPTFKAVHFDSHLEHVRHFLQIDRPLAVSAGSSPVDNYDSDTEYPFSGDGRSKTTSSPFEWEIIASNFPVETPARKAQAVKLERVWLSSDQKCLLGSVAVANLAFQKYVTCRFTLDYWKTTSEVTAEYAGEVRPCETPLGQDRFTFTIKLSDMANLESKTMYFCIRYNVSGQEHWDNNGGTNFQVDFRKKMAQQNGKKGVIGASSRPVNGLPKSTRRSNPSRPQTTPLGADDFGDAPKLNFDQSLHDYLGESLPAGIRLKGVRSSSNIPSDNLTSRLSTPSGQAFANRYDFGASLTAAIQTAKDNMSSKNDGLYMKSLRRTSGKPAEKEKNDRNAGEVTTNQSSTTAKPTPGITTDSPRTSISSTSYEELVNKYCFVRGP